MKKLFFYYQTVLVHFLKVIAILREQSYTVTHSNKNEQLSEVNKMKNQNFGVEIELTGITRKRAAAQILYHYNKNKSRKTSFLMRNAFRFVFLH